MNWQDQVPKLRPPRLSPRVVAEGVELDQSCFWVPEKLTPLGITNSYSQLTDRQQLLYNQCYALQLLEEFSWIESKLIIRPLERVKRHLQRNATADQVIGHFIQDEYAHVSAFDRLRGVGASLLKLNKRLFQPTSKITMLGQFASFGSHYNTFWIEVVRTFEAYAVEISRAYHEDKSLEPTFRSVFVAHGQDEARHVQYDDLLAGLLKDNQALLLRLIDSRLSDHFLSAYYSPAWGMSGPIEALISHNEDLRPQAQALASAAMLARGTNSALNTSDHTSKC